MALAFALLAAVAMCAVPPGSAADSNAASGAAARFRASARPNYEMCASPAAQGRAWCDESLSVDARMDALLEALTVAEMVTLTSPDAGFASECNGHTSAVPRLGLLQHMWLMETNTDAASDCTDTKCRTALYGPLGYGASWNATAWRTRGHILSREVRAMRNAGFHRPQGRTPAAKAEERIGLTAFGPNINIARDPRFGRTSELPGEDPFHVGSLGAEMVLGMQEPDAQGRPRALCYLKHFTAYSVEENRGHDDHNISHFDLHDTYLRQYEIASKVGRPAGAMCSYNGVNGQPMCANGPLLNGVFRERWGQPDAAILTDCGAVRNLMKTPLLLPTGTLAAAWAINNGTDMELGTDLFRGPQGLAKAMAQGIVKEATVAAAVRRLFKGLMRGGLFDTFGASEHDALTYDDVVQSAEHERLDFESALQAPVLLRNDELDGGNGGAVLPLRAGASVALLGPMGNSTLNLLSSYASPSPLCPKADPNCGFTLLQAMTAEAARNGPDPGAGAGAEVRFSMGVDLAGPAAGSGARAAALALANRSDVDVVVLALGNAKAQEHEGRDRDSTDLQPCQTDFAFDVLALGKPTVLVLVNGGPLSMDWLPSAAPGRLAVVEAFNPNLRGSAAVAALLSGRANRWGKLPYTVYPSAYQHQVNKFDFDMSKPPGRTYRFFTGKPVYPFGFGLSYTQFAVKGCDCGGGAGSTFKVGEPKTVTCEVENLGDREGDEVVQLYHSASAGLRARIGDAHPVPLRSLVAFERVTVPSKATATVTLTLGPEALALANQDGDRVVHAGAHEIQIKLGSLGGSAHPDPVRCTFLVQPDAIE